MKSCEGDISTMSRSGVGEGWGRGFYCKFFESPQVMKAFPRAWSIASDNPVKLNGSLTVHTLNLFLAAVSLFLPREAWM